MSSTGRWPPLFYQPCSGSLVFFGFIRGHYITVPTQTMYKQQGEIAEKLPQIYVLFEIPPKMGKKTVDDWNPKQPPSGMYKTRQIYNVIFTVLTGQTDFWTINSIMTPVHPGKPSCSRRSGALGKSLSRDRFGPQTLCFYLVVSLQVNDNTPIEHTPGQSP